MTSVERLLEDVLDGASVRPGISVRPPQSMRSAEWGRSGSPPRTTRTIRSPSTTTVERGAGPAPVQSSNVQSRKTVAPIAGSSMREGPRGAMAQHWVLGHFARVGLGQVASETRREGSEQRRRSGSYDEQRNDRETKYRDANWPSTQHCRLQAGAVCPLR